MTTPDHFQRLGLPRRFSIDPAELERRYLATSRAVHPDYHATGTAGDLAASQELSAAANEAYNTLKDPFTRADYLLRLDGGPSAGEYKQMPPAFLEAMLEAREQVEEARAANSPCGQRAAELREQFNSQCAALLDDVAGRYSELDVLPADDPKRPNLHREVRGLLNAAKYVRGLLRDLDAD